MKILFVDTTHVLLKEKLEKIGYQCHTAYSASKLEIEQIIHQYEGIIIRSRFNIDLKFINKALRLKFIARAGSGLENIDIRHAERKGIKCYNASEGNRQAVAEHAIGMLLALFNNLKKSDEEIRQGKWEREANRGMEICNKKIGIIGYGNNGSAFANIAKGFGAKILAYDKYLEKYPYKSSMQKIYQEADIISIHVPLTKETRYLVDDYFINKLQKNIYLINTARGLCVNTEHLVSALKNGKIRGACLDVLEYEKNSFEHLGEEAHNKQLNFLTKSNNVLLSPHIAGWSIESKIKIAEILLEKIISDFPL